VSIIVKVVEIL